MTTHIIMNVDRPDDVGGTYKAGEEYDLPDDLAVLWRGMGICRLTSVTSEQLGTTIVAGGGSYPKAPALSTQSPVMGIASPEGAILFVSDMKQALYEQGVPVTFRQNIDVTVFATTARTEFMTIPVPKALCKPGTRFIIKVQFSGTANGIQKTLVIAPVPDVTDEINDSTKISPLKGGNAVFDAAITTNPFGGDYVEAYFDVISEDVIQGGQFSSIGGIGVVSSSVANNPKIYTLNSRRGIAIALGVTIAAPTTGTVDFSPGSPGLFSKTAHGFNALQMLAFTSPPAPLVNGDLYFVESVPTADTGTLSDFVGGPALPINAAASAVAYTAYTAVGVTSVHIEVSK